ncbi:MAG: hypothetical protein KDB48_07195 [Solirubrobacterales bacterium]|nr:hypothetical protein [Solirubrobacterales bacterium]HMT05207.1 hypothetical protein [Solirubrobacterales bacterium]
MGRVISKAPVFGGASCRRGACVAGENACKVHDVNLAAGAGPREAVR